MNTGNRRNSPRWVRLLVLAGLLAIGGAAYAAWGTAAAARKPPR